jgi:16S rRNA (guanine966-N2)-methyltransferase
MRVIAGELKGQRLVAPRGWRVRPTSDRVREAVFSALGERVAGARVLDLYCGTGALAIEALSRGAVTQDLTRHLPDLLAADGRAVIESGARRPLRIDSLESLRSRRYGAADVTIYGASA